MAGPWLSSSLESGSDKKPWENAKISPNLTTRITSLYLGLRNFGGVAKSENELMVESDYFMRQM